MRYALMGALMTTYILLQIFFSGFQDRNTIRASGTLNEVVQAQQFDVEVSAGNPLGWIGATQNFFASAYEVGSWDYPFFEGDYNYLRQVLLAFTFVMSLMMLVTLGPIAISGITALRSLLPF